MLAIIPYRIIPKIMNIGGSGIILGSLKINSPKIAEIKTKNILTTPTEPTSKLYGILRDSHHPITSLVEIKDWSLFEKADSLKVRIGLKIFYQPTHLHEYICENCLYIHYRFSHRFFHRAISGQLSISVFF